MSRAKTTSRLFEQQDRIFRRLMEIGKRRARTAHPETGGIEHLVHNWGNEAARAVWRDVWARWRRVDAAYRPLLDSAEHRRHGPDFRPLWCDACRRKLAAADPTPGPTLFDEVA